MMAGHLLDEDCNFSQLIDVDKFGELSILDVDNLNTSLVGVSGDEESKSPCTITSSNELSEQTSGKTFLNDAMCHDNGNNDSKLSVFMNNPKQYYQDLIEPSCSNLGHSYFEILTDPKPKGEEEIRAIVASRVQKILESVKREVLNKSISCPNLQKLKNKTAEEDSSSVKSPGFNFQNIKNEQLNDKTFDINNLNSSFQSYSLTGSKDRQMNRFVSGSVEVLNNPNVNDSFTYQSRPYDAHMDTYCNGSFYSLQKSFSSSCLPCKNDSIMDIEPKLEDSVPSEDEVDEMGLPVKRFIYTHTPLKKNDDLLETIVKYKNMRASIGEPNIQDDEPEALVKAVKEPPLLQEIKDTQLKKTQSTISKGPLKAFVPLQNMTKQMGVKIMSPFKKKKEKKLDITSRSRSSEFGDSFEVINPMAASTPSGGRPSRRDSMGNQSSFTRSTSEGRITPVKKTNGPILNVTHTKSDQPHSSKLNSTVTISKPVKQPPKPTVSSLLQSKMKFSSGKRSSVAPSNPLSSIKAPLTTNRCSVNQPVANRSTIPKVSLPRMTLAKTSINNTRSSLKNMNPVSTIKKPLVVSKLRRPTSAFDKENKIK